MKGSNCRLERVEGSGGGGGGAKCNAPSQLGRPKMLVAAAFVPTAVTTVILQRIHFPFSSIARP